MSALSELVGSKIRAEVFRLLFSGTERELHVREIERRSGFNDRAIRQELARLTRLELVIPRRDGNRLYYSARMENPLFPEIRGLTLKTVGLCDVLRTALKSDKVQVAFIFGSVARGSEKVGSDVDLMVVGALGMRDVTTLLSGTMEKIGREINPHVFTVAAFKARCLALDHFVTSILAEPKFFVKGNEHELADLAK